MKTSEIINNTYVAFTIDEKVYVEVREIKNRRIRKPYYLVEKSNIQFTTEQIRFESAKKALDYFHKLCVDMNLCSYNHSL